MKKIKSNKKLIIVLITLAFFMFQIILAFSMPKYSYLYFVIASGTFFIFTLAFLIYYILDVRKYALNKAKMSINKTNFITLIMTIGAFGLFSMVSIDNFSDQKFPEMSRCEYYDSYFNEIHSDFIYGTCPTYEVISNTGSELKIQFKNQYIGDIWNEDTFVPISDVYMNPKIEDSQIEEVVDVSVFYDEDGNTIRYYNQTTLVTTMNYMGDIKSHYVSYITETNYIYTDDLLSITRDSYYHYEINSGNSDLRHYDFLPDERTRELIEVSVGTGEILKNGVILYTISEIDQESNYLLVTDGNQTSEYRESKDVITWNLQLNDGEVRYKTFDTNQDIPLLKRHYSNWIKENTTKYDVYDNIFTPYTHIEPDKHTSVDLYRLSNTEFGYVLESMRLDDGLDSDWENGLIIRTFEDESINYLSDYKIFFSKSISPEVILEKNVILDYLLN